MDGIWQRYDIIRPHGWDHPGIRVAGTLTHLRCLRADSKHPQADSTFFQRREFCFTLDGDIFVRYQSFKVCLITLNAADMAVLMPSQRLAQPVPDTLC